MPSVRSNRDRLLLFPHLEVLNIVPVRNLRSQTTTKNPPAVPAGATDQDQVMAEHALIPVVVKALEDVKAKDISVLDVRGRTSVTDFMIIASGTSNRHVKSLADNVVDEIKLIGEAPLSVEGGAGNDWILVDLGDIVVHVMLPAAREFYDLERFWRDAPAPGDLSGKK